MIELKSGLYEPLIDILAGIPFNTWFVRSVLAGHADGRVFVDREINPTAIYVCHKYGMTFLYGDSGNDEFKAGLLRYFGSVGQDEWLQAYPRDWDNFMASHAKVYSRLNFTFNYKIFEQNCGGVDLDDYGIEEGSIEVMKNFSGRVVPINFWKENLLSMCKSYIARIDGAPVSIAYSSYIHSDITHGDILELGIETLENHRGKGLALAACIALIRYCIKQNLTPVWSCRSDNIGSVKLADRLGFVETMRFPYYHIPAK